MPTMPTMTRERRSAPATGASAEELFTQMRPAIDRQAGIIAAKRGVDPDECKALCYLVFSKWYAASTARCPVWLFIQRLDRRVVDELRVQHNERNARIYKHSKIKYVSDYTPLGEKLAVPDKSHPLVSLSVDGTRMMRDIHSLSAYLHGPLVAARRKLGAGFVRYLAEFVMQRVAGWDVERACAAVREISSLLAVE